MSKTYLFALFCLVVTTSNFSWAQVARSFFSTAHEGIPNDAIVFNTPTGDVFCSLKNSSTDNLVLVFGELDADGETTEYASLDIPGMIGNYYVISGYAYSGAEVQLAILADKSTSMDLIHVRFDRATNTLLDAQRYDEDFRRGFVRSRQKGNELITYIATNANVLQRISTEVSNITNSSAQLVDASETYNASFLGQGRKMIELLIDPNGNEYALKESKLYKRKANQAVDTLMMPAWQIISGYDLELSEDGRLNVFSSLKFNQIDTAALSVLNSGDLGNVSPIGYPQLTVFSSSAGFTHFATDNMGNLHIYDVNPSFSVNNHIATNHKVKVFDIQRIGSDFLLSAKKNEAVGLHSVAFFKAPETLVEPSYFEFNSEFSHFALKAQTGHLNSAFRNLASQVSGLTYEFSGIERNVFFNSSSGLLGTNDAMEVRGVMTGFSTDDFMPGPYTPFGLTLEANVSFDRHNRAYYVDRDMIDYHRQNYGQASYEIPFGIKQWPAHGIQSLGQSADLASFYDENNNFIYEPELGEYPLIYGDRCFLNLYHVIDSAYSLDVSDVPVEVLRYIYMFDCDTSEALNNTIFMRHDYKILDGALNEAHASVYVDGDLGNYSDDYVGTHVDLGMMYTYNGDLFDEDNAGQFGFKDTTAASAVMILRGAPAPTDMLDNNAGVGAGLTVNGFGYADGTVDNECYGLTSSLLYNNGATFPYNDPSNPAQAYLSYQGFYQDGSNQVLGSTPVYHAYFGDSDPQFYSSNGVDPGTTSTEYSPTVNPAGDRRMLGGSGPYTMSADDPTTSYFELQTAYVIAVDTLSGSVSDILTPLNLLFDLGASVKTKFNTNDAGCGKTFDPYISPIDIAGVSEQHFEFDLYPNPTSGIVHIRTNLSGELNLQIYSLSGALVFEKPIQSQYTIETSEWESGVYIIKLTNGQELLNSKLIKW